MKRCPKCNQLHSDMAENCSHCGTSLSGGTNATNSSGTARQQMPNTDPCPQERYQELNIRDEQITTSGKAATSGKIEFRQTRSIQSLILRIIGFLASVASFLTGLFFVNEGFYDISVSELLFGCSWLLCAIVCFFRLSIRKNIRLKNNSIAILIAAIIMILLGIGSIPVLIVMGCGYCETPVTAFSVAVLCTLGLFLIPVQYD